MTKALLPLLLGFASFGVSIEPARAATDASYKTQRLQLMGSGWRPVHNVGSETRTGRDFGDARIMYRAGFREVKSCTGVGRNYCFFTFRKGSMCLEVMTAGEYSAANLSPHVIRISRKVCSSSGAQ